MCIRDRARTNLNPVQEVTAAIKRVEACFSTAQEETDVYKRQVYVWVRSKI